MGSDALQDLNLAGVRWELTEKPVTFEQKKSLPEQSLQEFPNRQNTKPIIVPPSAPVCIDTIKSMVEHTDNIDSVISIITEFNHPLRNGATNVVLPSIAKQSNHLLIVTDIPSTEDDLSGKILSGTAGDLIDKMLSAIAMSRNEVSIIPLLFWRTPGGRTPTREELDLSRPFINKIIEIQKPHIIVTLGTLATAEITQKNLASVHGNEIQDDKGYIVVPIYHPNYLILKPSAKRDVWTALQNVQKLLKNV